MACRPPRLAAVPLPAQQAQPQRLSSPVHLGAAATGLLPPSRLPCEPPSPRPPARPPRAPAASPLPARWGELRAAAAHTAATTPPLLVGPPPQTARCARACTAGGLASLRCGTNGSRRGMLGLRSGGSLAALVRLAAQPSLKTPARRCISCACLSPCLPAAPTCPPAPFPRPLPLPLTQSSLTSLPPGAFLR